jgi:hypothetical protein
MKLRNMAMNGLFSPAARDAEKDLLKGKIEKMSNGRYNGDSADAIADSMLPRRFESNGTSDIKPERIDTFFDTERANEPNLTALARFGIQVPRGHVSGVKRTNLNLPNYPKRGG